MERKPVKKYGKSYSTSKNTLKAQFKALNH